MVQQLGALVVEEPPGQIDQDDYGDRKQADQQQLSRSGEHTGSMAC